MRKIIRCVDYREKYTQMTGEKLKMNWPTAVY